MKKFNINDYIYIQITEKGWQHLKKTVEQDYIDACIIPQKVEIYGEIWYRLQTHNIFDLFEGNTLFGFFLPNVMFDDKALT